MLDHDQLFKRLLHAFFPEFLAAFVRELHRDLDPKSSGPEAGEPRPSWSIWWRA